MSGPEAGGWGAGRLAGDLGRRPRQRAPRGRDDVVAGARASSVHIASAGDEVAAPGPGRRRRPPAAGSRQRRGAGTGELLLGHLGEVGRPGHGWHAGAALQPGRERLAQQACPGRRGDPAGGRAPPRRSPARRRTAPPPILTAGASPPRLSRCRARPPEPGDGSPAPARRPPTRTVRRQQQRRDPAGRAVGGRDGVGGVRADLGGRHRPAHPPAQRAGQGVASVSSAASYFLW